MFSIIGIVVVFGCIVAAYLMEHGNMLVLMQPAELLIIGGAAVGTVLIANPMHILKQMTGGLLGAFGSSKYTMQRYTDSLKMMYELLQKARKEGLVALETDIEEPDKSPLFSKYADFAKNHHAMAFICDTMRMAVSGGVEVFDLDQMLEADMEVHHHGANEPVAALATMADSLPGLGIVACVLGVVVTMGALGGPPEEIGKKVAAALVGTFLGILLCYGLVGPLAARMGKTVDEEHAFLLVLRVTMIAFLKGVAPIMAVEIGRRTVPGHVRPSFQEVEEACRGAKDEARAAVADRRRSRCRRWRAAAGAAE
jgi:chemotaxis protein MotA